MNSRIKPGDIVRHFKYQDCPNSVNYMTYKVICFGNHSETNEKMVCYQALYGEYKICIRPYEMFMSERDTEKYPDYIQKYRFEVIHRGE